MISVLLPVLACSQLKHGKLSVLVQQNWGWGWHDFPSINLFINNDDVQETNDLAYETLHDYDLSFLVVIACADCWCLETQSRAVVQWRITGRDLSIWISIDRSIHHFPRLIWRALACTVSFAPLRRHVLLEHGFCLNHSLIVEWFYY